ncbi:MAG: DUF1127 domain-containing protein [Pseudomonadota bacterium]
MTTIILKQSLKTHQKKNGFRKSLKAFWRRFLKWQHRRAAAMTLRQLDDRLLKDLGIHRSEITAIVHGLRDRNPNATRKTSSEGAINLSEWMERSLNEKATER